MLAHTKLPGYPDNIRALYLQYAIMSRIDAKENIACARRYHDKPWARDVFISHARRAKASYWVWLAKYNKIGRSKLYPSWEENDAA